MNVLLSRTDRLGDVLQSMAGLRSLKERLGGGKIGFLLSKANAPLLKDHPSVDRIHCHEETDGEALKCGGYDAAVVFFYDAKAVTLIKQSGIKRRIGPLSKIGSFFFFNEGIRQHRSASVKNEAEYNCDLLRGVCPGVAAERPQVFNPGTPPAVFLPARYAVIAPQSRNSAPNISDGLYLGIAQHLSASSVPIVLCGTEKGGPCGRIASSCRDALDLSGATTLDELIAIIRGALFVIAPSTGTLHLANALGKRVLSFFPPKKTIGALRWSPYRYEGKIFSAQEPCDKKCRLGRECSDRCMNFSIEGIKAEIDKLLNAA